MSNRRCHAGGMKMKIQVILHLGGTVSLVSILLRRA
jgi:hypothetical protein